MEKKYSFEGLSLEETKEIFKKYKLGEISLNELVISNIGLVKKIALNIFKNYKISNFELDDLIQEGCISLYKAILNYDDNKNFKFSTYAYSVIQNDLLNIYLQNITMVSSSRNSIVKASKVKSFLIEYNKQNEKNPTIDEIATALNMSTNSIQSLYNLSLGETRFEKLLSNSDSDDTEGLKKTISNDENVEDEVINELFKEELMNILNTLDEKSKNFLLYRYGFVDGVCHSLEEIAKKEGLSRQAVGQKEKRLFTKCKKICLQNGLYEFLK